MFGTRGGLYGYRGWPRPNTHRLELQLCYSLPVCHGRVDQVTGRPATVGPCGTGGADPQVLAGDGRRPWCATSAGSSSATGCCRPGWSSITCRPWRCSPPPGTRRCPATWWRGRPGCPDGASAGRFPPAGDHPGSGPPGAEPLAELFRRGCVPLATPATPGALWRGDSRPRPSWSIPHLT